VFPGERRRPTLGIQEAGRFGQEKKKKTGSFIGLRDKKNRTNLAVKKESAASPLRSKKSDKAPQEKKKKRKFFLEKKRKKRGKIRQARSRRHQQKGKERLGISI